jgi:hypothetical protein
MPRLVVQRFLEGALQIPISLGSTQNAWDETSGLAADHCADLSAPATQCARVPDGRRRRSSPSSTSRVNAAIAAHPLNCYGFNGIPAIGCWTAEADEKLHIHVDANASNMAIVQ